MLLPSPLMLRISLVSVYRKLDVMARSGKTLARLPRTPKFKASIYKYSVPNYKLLS